MGFFPETGQDAFVQLVVSTYKDAARLVSNVGEHSAIFALLGRWFSKTLESESCDLIMPYAHHKKKGQIDL